MELASTQIAIPVKAIVFVDNEVGPQVLDLILLYVEDDFSFGIVELDLVVVV